MKVISVLKWSGKNQTASWRSIKWWNMRTLTGKQSLTAQSQTSIHVSLENEGKTYAKIQLRWCLDTEIEHDESIWQVAGQIHVEAFFARCEETISMAIQRWHKQSRAHFWAPPGDGRLDDPGRITTAHRKPLALPRICKSKMTEGVFAHWPVIDWIFS